MNALAILLIALLACVVSFSPDRIYTVRYDTANKEWSIQEGRGGIADALWEETRFKTGWDTLRVWTKGQEADELQAYAAGFIEGALLEPLIWDAWRTDTNGTGPLPPKVVKWLKANDDWTRNQVKMNPANSYWVQVGLVLQQSDAILAGYNKYAPKHHQFSPITWLAYQYGPELGDVFEAVGETDLRVNRKKQAPYFQSSHCSGLVKLTPDRQELLTSHDTWSGFSSMLRVYKFFETPFAKVQNVKSMQYSGYPGSIPSGDDFYITSSNLVVMETTNDIFNNTLYKYVVPQNVMYWIRITVANRMATTGQEWTKLFSLYNSGTYNNQWMVVDYKRFRPGQPLTEGTLWVAEQIPGLVQSQDMTSTLERTGYWASYNIPYFPNVYNLSGYPAYFQKYGNEFSYENCARAQIFRRDQHSVVSMETMKHIMRYNQWQTDPLSLKDACRGISARCDLNPPWIVDSLNGYTAFGAIDCKVTDHKMAPKMTSLAVAGPSWQSQPPFAWTEEWKYFPHWSQPTVFAFDFVEMSPYLCLVSDNKVLIF